MIVAHRPDLAVLRMAHPSPTYVCTKPSIAGAIQATLAQARALAGSDSP